MTTFVLFVLSVFSSSMSQYWQKRAAMLFAMQPELRPLQKLFSRPMILSVLFLGAGAMTWLGVLTVWDVSMAYPLLSINFVIMLLLSHYIFEEPISVRQWIGIALIMLGVIILAGGEQWLI